MNHWLTWAEKLMAISQNGTYFSKDPYDAERYQQIKEVAIEMIKHYSKIPEQQIIEVFSQEKGYVTPKLDVRGVVFKQEQILLVKERSDQLWTLPGGWVDINESPSESAEREILEESGYKTQAKKIIAIYDKLKHDHPPQLPHTYKIFILCEIISFHKCDNIETSEAKFFSPDKLPNLSLHRVTKAQILSAFEHLHNPSLPTDFD